jgi:WD40 repeat protein
VARTTTRWTPVTVCPISSVKLQGNTMVTGSIDKVVKIWDVERVTSSNTLFGHDGPVRCVQFDEEKIISGSDDCVRFARHSLFRDHARGA